MRLMITRPQDDGRPLADALADLGVETLLVPLLSIEVLDGPALNWDDVQAVLVTSANGVRALAARDTRRDHTVYAVGDATARAARDAGFADVLSAGGDVDTLAALVSEKATTGAGALVHVAGSKVAGDLQGLLAAKGFRYRREVLYTARTAATLPTQAADALSATTVDGVVFFSPRTAKTFAALTAAAGLGRACERLTAYCLSAAVAEQASALAWQKTVVAARPEQAALLDAIEQNK